MPEEEKKYLKVFGRVLKKGKLSDTYDIGVIELKTVGFIGDTPFTGEPPTSLAIYKNSLEEDRTHTSSVRLAYLKRKDGDWKLHIDFDITKDLNKKELEYFRTCIAEAYEILENPGNFVTLEEYKKLS